MPDLLTAAEKSEYQAALDDVFLTFCRPITIIKQNNIAVVSSDPNVYNWIYGNDQIGIATTETFVSGIFQGSINWLDPAKDNNYKELRPEILGNYCQLDLRLDAYTFLQDYYEIIVDGIPTRRKIGVRPHALFDPTYYQITLVAAN